MMNHSEYFLKINTAENINNFIAEKKGIETIKNSNSFIVPHIFKVDTFENFSYLLSSYISSLEDTENPKDFAEKLAKLHQNTNDYYGLTYNNYIGELNQINTIDTNWVSFYTKNRLQYQVNLAGDKIPISFINAFEKLYQKLPEILSVEKPSLLHGDLWNGNSFYNLQGKSVIFDPSVYYGNREIDLAMMRLFGGYDHRVYKFYNQIFPLEKNWKERVMIYQLYPLLTHLNLGNLSYLSSLQKVINHFI
jgi:fructosamine-3-kinase